MKKLVALGTAVAALAALALGSTSVAQQPQSASAELRDANAEVVGTVTFVEEADGVRITVEATNLPPGVHGLHIHEVGQCSPDFAAAGGHYNPLEREHGLDNPNGPHAGDLPNLEVAEDGTGNQEVVNNIITLSAGSATLFDADGSAVIVHADPDDGSQPSGNAGARIACGIVTAAAQEEPTATSPAPTAPSTGVGGDGSSGGSAGVWLIVALAAVGLAAVAGLAALRLRARQ